MKHGTITRLELFYRAAAPDAARRSQERIFERLHELERVSETRVETRAWPMRVILEADRDERADAALASYATFTEWAHEHHVSLDPYFHVHECHWFTGEDCNELVFPVMCLAVYDADERLVNVFPHTERGRAVSVGAFLAELEAKAGLTDVRNVQRHVAD